MSLKLNNTQLNKLRSPALLARAIKTACISFLLIPFSAVMAQTDPDGDDELFEPCHIKGVEELAKCATLQVPLDYENPGGAMIDLGIAVLPPSGGQPTKEPLYFLAGGPGQVATEQGLLYERILRRARRGRTTILVDQRGTGRSSPLTCSPPLNPMAGGGEVAKTCLEQINQDPAFFRTHDFIQDLDHVRETLGHETLSLMGISYGTRAALAYVRAYPARVRAMVLDSIAPPHVPIFTQDASFASKILVQTLTDCANDIDCEAAFPNLQQRLDGILENLETTPALVTIPETDGVQVAIDNNTFLFGFRGALYSPPATRLIPFAISEATKGNFAPWLAIADFGAQQIGDDISVGLNLSVQCAEEVPNGQLPGEPAPSKYFPNGYDLFWKDACEAWPAGTAPEGYNAPVKSNVPALLMSGGLDPITPPQMGDLTIEHLENAVHLIAPNAGHSVVVYGCAERLVGEFLDHADPAQLEGSCLEEISKPVFTADRFGPKP